MINALSRRSNPRFFVLSFPLFLLAAAGPLPACSSDPETAPASGGSSNSGGGSGGAPGGSTSSGGSPGGAPSGGTPSGGSASAGTTSGGTPSGGNASGGSAGTGGSSSAGTGGAEGGGASGGTGGGSTATLIVADDFESASGTTPDAAKWSIYSGDAGNSVVVSTEQAHGGTRSIKVDVKNAGAMLWTKVGLPLASGALYYRAWARFANGASSTATWQPHVTFIEAGGLLGNGDVDQGDEARLGGQAGKIAANLSKGDGLSPNPYTMPCALCTDPPASNTWVCVEGMFDVANQKLSAWVDGKQVVKAEMASDWHAGSTYPASLQRIGFGWEAYGSVANTVYYDDIAVSAERIGCD